MKLFDLTGKVFGRLTVLEYAGKNGKLHIWKCKCECGKEHFTNGNRLRDGSAKSCGCYKSEISRKKASKGYGEASFNALYASYQRQAERRGLPFSLTKEQFRHNTSLNCYYCNTPPSQKISKSAPYINGHYLYNGLDRVNNEKGYEEGNVVPCCISCNKAKMALSQTAFFNLIQKIYENRLIEHKVLVAASGASGQIYTKTLLDYFVKENIKFDFLFSSAAEQVAQQELSLSYREFLQGLNKTVYDVKSFNAPSASSSTWDYSSMIVVPASMGATSRIAKGLSSNLIERSFDVALAMKVKTVLVPREGVFTEEHLSDMLLLSRYGTIIAPACPSFYSGQQTYDDVVNSVVGKLLSILGIKNSVRKPWVVPTTEKNESESVNA